MMCMIKWAFEYYSHALNHSNYNLKLTSMMGFGLGLVSTKSLIILYGNRTFTNLLMWYSYGYLDLCEVRRAD